MTPTRNSDQRAGFTLLEVLIAMSILAVGATSVLAIFVAAIQFHTDRVEENRLTEIYNHAQNHARTIFDNFDPSKVKEGQARLPAAVTVDLTNPEAERSADALIVEAYEKFPGFKYVITFEDNEWAVAGSSVVAHIEIFGLSGRKNETFSHKQFLTRSGAPIGERFNLPSIADRDKRANDGKRR